MIINVLVIEVAGLDVTFSVVVGTLEDRSAPLSQKALGHALDIEFGPLALGVEEDDLADAGGHEGVLLDGEAEQGVEDLALDLVGGQGAVVERLEEELDVQQEVRIRIDNSRLVPISVQHRHDFGK